MSEFLQELDALQRWVVASAGLSSIRLNVAPPKLARPVILWETPQRGQVTNVSRWKYTQTVTQFGKLYAANLDKLTEYQASLTLDLEERLGTLQVFDNDTAGGVVIGHLKKAAIRFENSETLDVPFNIRYEVSYGRNRGTIPGPAVTVTTKTKITTTTVVKT